LEQFWNDSPATDGCPADELIGGLSRDADAVWKDRADAARAPLLAKDDDNKSLFSLIPRTSGERL
jgi:hypothetical protein